MKASALLIDPDVARDLTKHQAAVLLEVVTPIAKSWPSEWCLEANSLAIQVHGGYGYTRDYNVEQFYRDQRLNPIHEGTHGIQGLDLLGRKVRLSGGAAGGRGRGTNARTDSPAAVVTRYVPVTRPMARKAPFTSQLR